MICHPGEIKIDIPPMHLRSCTTTERSAKSAGRRGLVILYSVSTGLISLLALTGCGEKSDGSAQGGPPGQSSGQNAPAANVRYLELQPQSIHRKNSLPGRVVAYQSAEIRPQVSGIIQSRLFKEGSYVEEGQQLYQIDPARYEADFDRAQATLKNEEARRKNTQAQASRYATLIKSGAVSQQQYDDAVAALDQAKAAVSMAKAEVRMAEINLNYTKVRSPIGGHISPSTVTKGALVTEGQPMPLATVRQLDPVYVDLSKSAAAANDLRERLTAARLENDGQAAFPVKLYPTQTEEPYAIEGTLDATELAVDPQTGSIRLRSIFPNPDKLLLPGMFVRATVIDQGQSKSIVIPQKSVKIEPDGSQSVWVVDSKDQAKKRSIRTGNAYDNQWIVLEGLQAGDRLVVEGGMSLSDGARVQAEKIQPKN